MSLTYIYHKDCLKGEYLEIFDKVELYANVNEIGEDTKNDALMNLLDMLSTAQTENKPPLDIVGRNLERFCKEYFSNYGVEGRVLEALKTIYRTMWLVLVISIMEMFAICGEEGFDFFKSSTDIMPYFIGYVSMGVIIIIINSIFKNLMFRKKISSKIYDFVVTIACVIFICFVFFVYSGDTFFAFNIPLFWSILVSGIYIVIYILVSAISNYKKYKSIRKPKEVGGFYDTLFDNIKKQDANTFVKKFVKINNKREKKGLPKLTRIEYMEEIRHKPDKIRRNAKRTTVVLMCIIFVIILQVVFTSTLLDSMIFILLITVIEVPLLRGVYKENTAEKALKQLIAECEEEGIDIFQYVERLEDKEI